MESKMNCFGIDGYCTKDFFQKILRHRLQNTYERAHLLFLSYGDYWRMSILLVLYRAHACGLVEEILSALEDHMEEQKTSISSGEERRYNFETIELFNKLFLDVCR
ncbi:MAG: hypothetical protein WC099_02470 [Candidatus Paceibacterota bacterium]